MSKYFIKKSFEQIMTTLFCLRIFNQNKITILGKLATFILRLILVFFIKSDGKRSLLRKSQRQKPKRTSKNLQTITTSKVPF